MRFLWPVLLVAPALAQQPVMLQWTPSTTAGTTVTVYRAPTCAGPFIIVGNNIPAPGPFSTVIPNTPGTSVAFQVTAVLAGVESAASTIVRQ